MKIRLQRAWIFALAALGLAEIAQAQVATPYLSSNRSLLIQLEQSGERPETYVTTCWMQEMLPNKMWVFR